MTDTVKPKPPSIHQGRPATAKPTTRPVPKLETRPIQTEPRDPFPGRVTR